MLPKALIALLRIEMCLLLVVDMSALQVLDATSKIHITPVILLVLLNCVLESN